MLCAYEGWDVRTADAGEPALRSAREQRPDVVLLDMMLPDMDGLTVLRRLRAEHPGLAVLVVSAREAGDRPALLAAGAAGYVRQPLGLAAPTPHIPRGLGGAAPGGAATPAAGRATRTTPARNREP